MVLGLGRQQENRLGTTACTPRHVDERAGLAGFPHPASRRGQSPPRTVQNRSPEVVCLRSMPDITPGATSQACFPLGGVEEGLSQVQAWAQLHARLGKLSITFTKHFQIACYQGVCLPYVWAPVCSPSLSWKLPEQGAQGVPTVAHWS